MKWVSVIITILMISSCFSKIPDVAYRCPIIKLPEDPIPKTRNLTDKSTPDEVVKAWVATATEYRDWNHIIRNQIELSQ